MSAMTQQLEQLEDTLLKTLSMAQGDILENQELIETLEEAKASAVMIETKLEQSTKTRISINKARDAY